MALTEYRTGSSVISTTEYSLVNDSTTIANDTTPGIYQLAVDVSAMQAGDTYVIRVRERARSAGSQRLQALDTLSGAQTDTYWVSTGYHLRNGWDFTIERTAGTDRTLEWSIRRTA